MLISAKSPFGVTAVDNQGNITFNNSGNVDIVGTIVPGNKSAQTNVVGIQSGSSGAETVVTDKVKDFNITLSGAGVDNDGTSYSTGTYGIILDKDVKALINSATLNIKMNVADNVEDISPGDQLLDMCKILHFRQQKKYSEMLDLWGKMVPNLPNEALKVRYDATLGRLQDMNETEKKQAIAYLKERMAGMTGSTLERYRQIN